MIGQYPAICLIRDLRSFFSSSAPSSISICVVLGARIHAAFFLGLFPPCFPVTARCLYPLLAMGHERARESRPRISRVAACSRDQRENDDRYSHKSARSRRCHRSPRRIAREYFARPLRFHQYLTFLSLRVIFS